MTEPLDRLLEIARTAAPNHRINYRDPIATHGRAAIDAVLPWLADPRLCRFAVRVVWKAGELGESDRAIAALREALTDPSVATDREDLAFHLRQLGFAPPPPPAPPRNPFAVSSFPVRAGLGWPGFQAGEFGFTDGTHWRSRDGEASLIPLLLRPLRRQHHHFESWSIYHSPEVHIAVKDRYFAPGDWSQGWRAAKLVVYAHGYTPERPDDPKQVTVGLYVEKGDGTGDAGPVDGRWDWPSYLDCLADPLVRDELAGAMARHDLHLGDYVGGNRFFPGAANVGFVGAVEDGDLVLRSEGVEIGRGWEALRARLLALPTDRWHDFHVWRSWPGEETMAAGPSFANTTMLPVLADLARVYLIVLEAGRTRSA